MQPVHLVVLCHGLWGEPKHLLTLESALCLSFGPRARVVGLGAKRSHQEASKNQKANNEDDAGHRHATDSELSEPHISDNEKNLLLPSIIDRQHELDMDIIVLNTSSNAGTKTYDGIDWLGERVFREIKSQQSILADKHNQKVARLSIVGYSLGGLVARYTIGLLEAEEYFTKQNVQPRQAVTIASPHIGAPRGKGAFGAVAAYVGGNLLSRTGEQLHCLDRGWESAQSMTHERKDNAMGLLEHMSLPDSVFIRGLRRFERVRFYANAVNDPTVPFRTGCIEEFDPFKEEAHVIVNVQPNTPLITSIEVQEAPSLSAGQTFLAAIPSFPSFFNPRRLPLAFPYNYMVVGLSPVLLPVMVCLTLTRFSRESKKSRLRIEKLEEGVEPEMRGPSRLTKLFTRVIQVTTEESIGESTRKTEEKINDAFYELRMAASNVSGGSRERRGSQIEVDADVNYNASNTRAPWSSSNSEDLIVKHKSKNPPLTASQMNMVRNLNDPNVLPQLQKVWTYYPDVVNAHALIICRVLSIEIQRQGLPVVRDVIFNFLP